MALQGHELLSRVALLWHQASLSSASGQQKGKAQRGWARQVSVSHTWKQLTSLLFSVHLPEFGQSGPTCKGIKDKESSSVLMNSQQSFPYSLYERNIFYEIINLNTKWCVFVPFFCLTFSHMKIPSQKKTLSGQCHIQCFFFKIISIASNEVSLPISSETPYKVESNKYRKRSNKRDTVSL